MREKTKKTNYSQEVKDRVRAVAKEFMRLASPKSSRNVPLKQACTNLDVPYAAMKALFYEVLAQGQMDLLPDGFTAKWEEARKRGGVTKPKPRKPVWIQATVDRAVLLMNTYAEVAVPGEGRGKGLRRVAEKLNTQTSKVSTLIYKALRDQEVLPPRTIPPKFVESWNRAPLHVIAAEMDKAPSARTAKKLTVTVFQSIPPATLPNTQAVFQELLEKHDRMESRLREVIELNGEYEKDNERLSKKAQDLKKVAEQVPELKSRIETLETELCKLQEAADNVQGEIAFQQAAQERISKPIPGDETARPQEPHR